MGVRIGDAWTSLRRGSRGVGPALLLGLIAAIALAVRLWGLRFGLPLVRSRPDELLILGVVRNLLDGDPNPRFFHYPALYLYLLAGLSSVYYVWGLLVGRFSTPAEFVASFRQHWEPFYLIGRATSAVLGSATVLATYGIAARLFGTSTGLLSAFFTALAFLHVRDSHYGTTDIPMTFFVICATLALIRAHEGRRSSDARLAGVLAGCAAATKYTAVLMAVPMLVAVALQAWPRRSDWRRALRETHLFWMFVPFGAMFLATNPYLVLDDERALRDLWALYSSTTSGMTPPDLLGTGWSHHLLVSLRYGLGWPLVAASLAGLCWMLYRAPASAAILSAFPIACYLVSGPAHNVFARYMVPVVPFLCIFAAFFVSEIAKLAAIRVGRPQPALAVGLALVLIAPSATNVLRFDMLLAQTDSRLIAAQWVREHVEAGSAIFMAGSHYGHPLLERGPNLAYRYFEFDGQAQVFKERRRPVREVPDWIVVQRSPLPYSDVPPAVERLLRSEYDLLHVVRATDLNAAGNVYDIQDAFYLPFGGFEGVRRPGPNLEIYQRRPIAPAQH